MNNATAYHFEIVMMRVLFNQKLGMPIVSDRTIYRQADFKQSAISAALAEMPGWRVRDIRWTPAVKASPFC
jgi:hypothetical protein